MPELIGEDRSTTSDSTARTRWGRKILNGTIALAGIGVLVMVVLYSYEKGNPSGASPVIPIISAQDGPTKIRPEKPGGMAIHHQDKNVYNRIDPTAKQAKVENLLPPPDPVMPKPGSTKIKKSNGLDPLKAISRKETSPIKSSLTVVSPAKRLVNKKDIKIVNKKLIPKVNTPLKAGYRVQFASLRSKSAAAASWKKLRDKYPSLLANLKANIERTVIVGKGTYYRLQAGIFNNSESARALCNRAKTKNIGCFIVKLR